ncbi:MAG: hypothetical protein IJK40_06465 [Clostridia bacterium]|nr:hypothetical protein [Clostridia bacterium]
METKKNVNGKSEIAIFANNAKGLSSIDIKMDLSRAKGISVDLSGQAPDVIFQNSGARMYDIFVTESKSLNASMFWYDLVTVDRVELLRVACDVTDGKAACTTVLNAEYDLKGAAEFSANYTLDFINGGTAAAK